MGEWRMHACVHACHAMHSLFLAGQALRSALWDDKGFHLEATSSSSASSSNSSGGTRCGVLLIIAVTLTLLCAELYCGGHPSRLFSGTC